MKLQCYPYDFDYKIHDGKVYLYIYSRQENGEKVCIIIPHEPFFYTEKKPDLMQVDDAKILRTEPVEKEFLGKKKNVWKAYVNYPKAVPLLSRALQEKGIECYEKDILFIHRFLRDLNITPLACVEAEGIFVEQKGMRMPVFKAVSLKELSKKAPRAWKILAVDIETYAVNREINPHKNPILMIAFYGKDEQGKEFQKVLTWKAFPHQLDYIEHLPDEASLLQRCKEIILEYNPHILTGYFSDGFDLPYIKVRAEKYNLPFDVGADFSPLIASSELRDGEAKIKGILHLDMLKFIKYIFGKNLKTDSYSLNAVAQELLGHKKHDVNLDELAPAWDRHPEKLADFCAYNLHDARLTYTLCQTLLPDIMEFTKIIGLPPFDVTRMRFSRLVENYILKRAVEYNILAPNKPGQQELEQRMEEHIQGAFVKEPTPGLYNDIVVFDFRSLYPSIITAHNIGPESFHCACCHNNTVPEQPGYWFCRKQKSFLATVLEELIIRRAELKELIKEAKQQGKGTVMLESRSYALKILANSFYGYLGFFGARWYCLECAASTTAYARDYIKNAIEQAQKSRFTVVYGDTDSMFLLLNEKKIEDATQFLNDINRTLPGRMELEYEGYYPKGIFVAVKGSEKGAKKKYALIDEKGKVKITGFETVRRNWSRIAKSVQAEVLRLVLLGKEQEALEMIRITVKELRAGTVPLSEVILKTQITRDLARYTTLAPHVAVAHKLAARGQTITPGTVVEYVIAKGEGLIRDRAVLLEDAKGYDADYYINNQLIPAVMPILQVMGFSEDQIFTESRQTDLGGFMGK